MKTTFISFAIALAACGGKSGGESGEYLAESEMVIAISHEKGQEPRGYLEIQPEGKWLYGSSDLCVHTQGSITSGRFGEIMSWVKDPGFKPYIGTRRCGETDYTITVETTLICWPEAETDGPASATSLVATFGEFAAMLKTTESSKCVANPTATPSGRTMSTDAPPPAMSPAAGSGG
ncbi:MAG TPA: hypothetical protein VFN67_10060 [Polyangiales bacterium]|nr:hypothetical protein [Polyangiales bacterium]